MLVMRGETLNHPTASGCNSSLFLSSLTGSLSSFEANKNISLSSGVLAALYRRPVTLAL